MRATLSILGLLEMDETILNGIILPSGLSLDTLKNNIILECAELEVIYSAPSFFRWAVDCWAIKELPIWERMWNAIQTEYNPLENYDRTETETETGTHSKQGNMTESGSHTKEDHDTDTTEKTASNSGTTHSETSGETSSDHYVYGFNDNSQVKQSSDTGTDSTETDGTTSASGTENTDFEHSGTESGTTNGSRTESESGNNSVTRNSRIHGNIGVTTSQQMLTAELELDKKINMYDIITRDFRNRFCILMY